MKPRTQTSTETDWTHSLTQEGCMLVNKLDRRQVPRSLFDGSISVDDYIDWLKQAYFYVRETPILLMKSYERMRQLGREHAMFAELLRAKISEEHAHDEWILSDLNNLGCSREEVERTGPCGAVKAYNAHNHCEAEEGSPYSIFGTGFVLEYLSEHRAGVAAANLVARSAIPRISGSVTFIRSHGQLDGQHVDEALSLLRRVSSPKHQKAILSTARYTASLIPGFFPKPKRAGRRKARASRPLGVR